MKVTVVLKKDDETWSYTGATIQAGNGVVQVCWDHGRRHRGWPVGDLKYYETKDEELERSVAP